jgi:hypothetical protein
VVATRTHHCSARRTVSGAAEVPGVDSWQLSHESPNSPRNVTAVAAGSVARQSVPADGVPNRGAPAIGRQPASPVDSRAMLRPIPAVTG